MTAMNELESVKKSLEQIAKSNAEAAVWRAESDAWRAKSDAWRALADKRHAEAEVAHKRFQKELAKLTQAMHETNKEVGGMSNTQGRTTEEFFLQALDKNRRLGELKFEHIRPNVRAYDCGQEAEFDILMVNGEVVAVIEVKHTLRREDVERMHEWTLPGFRRFLPEYDDKTLAPAMACIIAKGTRWHGRTSMATRCCARAANGCTPT